MQVGDRFLDLPAPPLVGAHQIDNAGLAVAAALALRHEGCSTRRPSRRGVAAPSGPARLQRLTARTCSADGWRLRAASTCGSTERTTRTGPPPWRGFAHS